VRQDHIETKILKRSAEDVVGEKMYPRPVDWSQWRRDHALGAAQSAGDPTAGMSKLQRDVYLRKQNKAKRRAAWRRACRKKGSVVWNLTCEP
jgi:hypothetical protein